MVKIIESHYVYLHGFASSPLSTKAQYLRQCFAESKKNLTLLDLNDNDFSHLTLTRQLTQAEKAFPPSNIPVTIIGSSFGGLTGAWLGEKHSQVERLILLAPAFDFLSHLLSNLGDSKVKQWQMEGYLSVYHYGKKQNFPLHYQFVTDLMQYEEYQIKSPISTLIVHGKNDDIIPIQASQNYAKVRDWVKLIELESDHGLTDVMPKVWQLIKEFIDLPIMNRQT